MAHWRDEATTDFWTAQAAGDHVVASSWRDASADRPEEAAAVYTFGPDGGATPTPSATPRPDGDPGNGTTAGDGTGLGPLAGAGAVGLAAWARRRWRD